MQGQGPNTNKLPITAEKLDTLLRHCVEVGEMQLQLQDDPGTYIKKDGSVVTDADKRAEAMIMRQLAELTPGMPVIGEEQQEENIQRNLDAIKNKGMVWVVDPLDGTRNYVGKSPDFSVNIALLSEPDENGQRKPVFGLIYAPATHTVYYTGLYGGAYEAKLTSDPHAEHVFETDPVRIQSEHTLPGLTQEGHSPEYLRVALTTASTAYKHPPKCPFLENVSDDLRIERVPFRSVQVAKGKFDAAYCSHSLYMWDVAAYDAIARATGKLMLPIHIEKKCITADGYDYRGTEYEGKPFRVPPYITISPELLPHIPHPPSLDRPKDAMERQ